MTQVCLSEELTPIFFWGIFPVFLFWWEAAKGIEEDSQMKYFLHSLHGMTIPVPTTPHEVHLVEYTVPTE